MLGQKAQHLAQIPHVSGQRMRTDTFFMRQTTMPICERLCANHRLKPALQMPSAGRRPPLGDRLAGFLPIGEESIQPLIGQRVSDEAAQDFRRQGSDFGSDQRRLAHMLGAAHRRRQGSPSPNRGNYHRSGEYRQSVPCRQRRYRPADRQRVKYKRHRLWP